MLTQSRFILIDRNVLQGCCEIFSAEECARPQEDNLELVLKLSKLVLKSIKNDSVEGGRNPNEVSVEPKTMKMDDSDTNSVNTVLEVESGGETPSFDNSYIDRSKYDIRYGTRISPMLASPVSILLDLTSKSQVKKFVQKKHGDNCKRGQRCEIKSLY